MAIYQEWLAKCEELTAEDGRKFLHDSQKVANAALSLLSNGADRTWRPAPMLERTLRRESWEPIEQNDMCRRVV